MAADAAWVGDPPIRLTRYVRQSPEPPQHAFLYADHIREILYGGAAGGGKSSALLAAALQYVDVPGYSALLLRRTFRDLAQPGALIPRSKDWLSNTDARWNDNDHRWTFPSGATLTFGYLQHEDDKLQYQGAEFQFIGWDELTQFTETQYTYLFSRCRRPEIPQDASDEQREKLRHLADVPLRVRAASNPGGPGHDWVRRRFGIFRNEGDPPDAPLLCHRTDWEPKTRVFIPARLRDNPHVDAGSYMGNLEELDHHTRRQLLDGDWDSKPPGDLFRREWFEIVDTVPAPVASVRYWDMAATAPSERNPDPDWTVGLRLDRAQDGTWYITDIVRLRGTPGQVRAVIQQTAELDGRRVPIRMEQEPGSSGKTVVDAYVREHLAAFNVKGKPSTGKKFARAQPASSKAEHGLIKLARGSWNTAFLNEVEDFGEDDREYAHDDQVDAFSGAFEELSGAPGPPKKAKVNPWR